jgi:hypothetical protein
VLYIQKISLKKVKTLIVTLTATEKHIIIEKLTFTGVKIIHLRGILGEKIPVSGKQCNRLLNCRCSATCVQVTINIYLLYSLELSFLVISFYLQSVLVHSANCVKTYTVACRRVLSSASLLSNRFKGSCDFWE